MKLSRDRLQRAREMLGYGLEKTAQEAGLSKNSVLRAEHEEDIRPVTARKIAAALKVSVADLIGESETSNGRASPPAGDNTLMDRPEVEVWLLQQGHTSKDEFLAGAVDPELEVDEDEFPHAVEEAIEDLRIARDGLLEELRIQSVQTALFGRAETEGLTGDARTREIFRPGRLARMLRLEIRREYAARELALVNYSKDLFVLGKASGYLAYGSPTREHSRERHQRMIEARRALEESYIRAAAV